MKSSIFLKKLNLLNEQRDFGLFYYNPINNPNFNPLNLGA